MAPSGQKLGKLVHPACQHSPFAKAFLCSHLTWQDRISKERSAAISVASLKESQAKPQEAPRKTQSLTALELARHEYHPIGGFSKHNNNSGQISMTLGPKSWHASGGLKSEYRTQVGNPTLPDFGSPPRASVDMSMSYVPNAVAQQRTEGQKKARADQLEAIQQHGEGTIVRLKRGDIAAANPAEEYVFRGTGTPHRSPGQSRGASAMGSVRSRLSSADSWGSGVGSRPSSELRRIDELGEKARVIGRKNAAVHQVEAMRQHGEQTILGMKKGLIPAENPAEEQLLAPRRENY